LETRWSWREIIKNENLATVCRNVEKLSTFSVAYSQKLKLYIKFYPSSNVTAAILSLILEHLDCILLRIPVTAVHKKM
jgi:hypothetical protein